MSPTSHPTSPEIEAKIRPLELSLLRELLDALVALYPAFTAKRENGMAVYAAVALMLGIGIRRSKVCVEQIETGWDPEALAHSRAIWEVAVDVGFLLNQRSLKERTALAQKYYEMVTMRAPQHVQLVDDEEGSLEQIRSANTNFVPAKDPTKHWSGRGKDVVRREAAEWIDPILDDGIVSATKSSFFGVASLSVHGDPGFVFELPTLPGKVFPSLDPVPPVPSNVPRQTYTAMLTLYAAASAKLGESYKTRARDLAMRHVELGRKQKQLAKQAGLTS